MQQLVALLSLIKWVIDTVKQGYELYLKKREEKRQDRAKTTEEAIKDAETEDDFRDAADRLSKLKRD